jgi:hypothetical protein
VTDRGIAVAAAIVTKAERDVAAAKAAVKSAAMKATIVEATAEAPTGACRGGREGTERGYCGRAVIVLRKTRPP